MITDEHVGTVFGQRRGLTGRPQLSDQRVDHPTERS
jgi:hypothetical protein